METVISSLVFDAGTLGNITGLTLSIGSVVSGDINGNIPFAVSENASDMTTVVAAVHPTGIPIDFSTLFRITDVTNGGTKFEADLVDIVGDYLDAPGTAQGWVLSGLLVGYVNGDRYRLDFINVVEGLALTGPLTFSLTGDLTSNLTG